MTALMEHTCCRIRVTKHYDVIVESEDAHVCEDVRRQAARLQDDGFRVRLSIKGMDRSR